MVSIQDLSVSISTFIVIAAFGLSIYQVVLERRQVRQQNTQIIKLLTEIRNGKTK